MASQTKKISFDFHADSSRRDASFWYFLSRLTANDEADLIALVQDVANKKVTSTVSVDKGDYTFVVSPSNVSWSDCNQNVDDEMSPAALLDSYSRWQQAGKDGTLPTDFSDYVKFADAWTKTRNSRSAGGGGAAAAGSAENKDIPDVEVLDGSSDMGGNIVPKTDCQHVLAEGAVARLTVADASAALAAECKDCGTEPVENWLCVTCLHVGCSRYVKAHMGAHCKQTGHLVAMSLGDLNFWCYSCSSYIRAAPLKNFFGTVYLAKFNELPQ